MADRMRAVRNGAALFVLTIPLVALVRVTLTMCSHRTVARLIPRGRMQAAHPALVFRMSKAVTRAARFVPRASCLTQALTLQLLLACRGYASEVRIGVKPNAAGGVDAHAWLLSDGCVAIGGTPDELARYAQLATLPPVGA